MTPKEMENASGCIADATSKSDTTFLIGSIAQSLLRIACAQEKVAELAEIDLSNAVEQEIQARAETLAEDIAKEKTARSFIGKRP